jgi:hypothetical protein
MQVSYLPKLIKNVLGIIDELGRGYYGEALISVGTVEKVGLYDFYPLCYFVIYFVILCGSMNYILPQRDTKVITKVHKGLFKRLLHYFVHF